MPAFSYQNVLGSHSSNVDDDCCVDCDPNSFPAPGQGCPIAIEMTSDNEDNVFASTVTTRAYIESSPFSRSLPTDFHATQGNLMNPIAKAITTLTV